MVEDQVFGAIAPHAGLSGPFPTLKLSKAKAMADFLMWLFPVVVITAGKALQSPIPVLCPFKLHGFRAQFLLLKSKWALRNPLGPGRLPDLHGSNLGLGFGSVGLTPERIAVTLHPCA